MNLKRFISPEETIDSLELNKKAVVIDFGTGSGHWAIAASKSLGPSGKVLAVDTNEDLLKRLDNFSSQLGYGHIETLCQNILNLSPAKIPAADLSILANILSVTRTKEAVLKKVFETTKVGGKLLVVEWLKEDSVIGPEKKSRLTKKEVLESAEKVGFKTLGEIPASYHHYGIVFEK